MKFLDSLKQSVAVGLQANGGDLRVKLTKKQTQDENKSVCFHFLLIDLLFVDK